jgi:hypothetical protein
MFERTHVQYNNIKFNSNVSVLIPLRHLMQYILLLPIKMGFIYQLELSEEKMELSMDFAT